jgi:hypothetical protein
MGQTLIVKLLSKSHLTEFLVFAGLKVNYLKVANFMAEKLMTHYQMQLILITKSCFLHLQVILIPIAPHSP